MVVGKAIVAQFSTGLHSGGLLLSLLLQVAFCGINRVFFMDTGRAGRQNGVPVRVEPPVLVQVILGAMSHLRLPPAVSAQVCSHDW